MAGFSDRSSRKPKLSRHIHQGAKILEKAVMQHKQGAVDIAEKLYREALQVGFEHPIVFSNLGTICRQTDRSEEALIYYQKALAISPGYADAQANLGALLAEKGMLDQATTALRKAIDLDPSQAGPHVTLGRILIRQGHLIEALGALHTALKINPNLADAHLAEGMVWISQGRLDRALASTKRAIELQPDLADAYMNLGGILLEQGRFDQALAATLKAIEKHPQNAKAYLNLGGILKGQGRLAEALLASQRALALAPDLAEAHLLTGSILQQQEQLEQALASIRQAISLMPDRADAYIVQAGILQELNMLDLAITSSQKAIALQADSALGYYCLGRLKNSLGDLEAGRRLLKQSVMLDPQETAAYLELSNDLASDEDAISLMAIMRKVCRERLTKKKMIWLLFAQANCHHRLKEYPRSAGLLVEANALRLDIAPSNCEQLIARIRQRRTLAPPADPALAAATECGAIFIVGMPRSGSTLLESILSTRPQTLSLGESRAMPAAIACLHGASSVESDCSLRDLYYDRLEIKPGPTQVSIDKNLYNFIDSALIARQMPEARIVHCRRNPLDAILSMFRASLKGNYYTASLADCAVVLIEQELAMREVKQRFPHQVATFQYEAAVSHPETAIRAIVGWLGWSWADHYLYPEKSERPINTASVIQARRPIHARSVDGWRHYASMLEPARSILSRSGLFAPEELGSPSVDHGCPP